MPIRCRHVWHDVILIELANVNIFYDAGGGERPTKLHRHLRSQYFGLGPRTCGHSNTKVARNWEPKAAK